MRERAFRGAFRTMIVENKLFVDFDDRTLNDEARSANFPRDRWKESKDFKFHRWHQKRVYFNDTNYYVGESNSSNINQPSETISRVKPRTTQFLETRRQHLQQRLEHSLNRNIIIRIRTTDEKMPRNLTS